MPLLRTATLIFGVLAILAGVLFMAQGSGVFPYPRSSFMIAQSGWIWRGGLVALFGAALVLASRRLPR